MDKTIVMHSTYTLSNVNQLKNITFTRELYLIYIILSLSPISFGWDDILDSYL